MEKIDLRNSWRYSMIFTTMIGFVTLSQFLNYINDGKIQVAKGDKAQCKASFYLI